jgi:hypothetical protein
MWHVARALAVGINLQSGGRGKAIPVLAKLSASQWRRDPFNFDLCSFVAGPHLAAVAVNPESPLDRLWQEYLEVFRGFDDLTLARWMAQTLGQIEGRVWRLSHPLIGAYRLAAQIANDRGLWMQRLATVPPAYARAECCRAPLLPLLTRDVKDTGLGCPHCGGTSVPLAEVPEQLRSELSGWSSLYAPVHAVAHWEDGKQKRPKYQEQLEEAAQSAEQLLATAGHKLAPRLLEHYPAVIWEDQDECLEVRPEDIPAEPA